MYLTKEKSVQKAFMNKFMYVPYKEDLHRFYLKSNMLVPSKIFYKFEKVCNTFQKITVSNILIQTTALKIED